MAQVKRGRSRKSEDAHKQILVEAWEKGEASGLVITAAPKVAAENAIHDGKGGFLKKGDTLPAGADVASLKAKGLAE